MAANAAKRAVSYTRARIYIAYSGGSSKNGDRIFPCLYTGMEFSSGIANVDTVHVG